MQIAIALLILLAIIPGLATSLDWLAYHLHLIAKEIRQIQHRLTCVMQEKWVKELEHKANLEIIPYHKSGVGN